ncbi:uncharacterized protein F5147DRAFT_757908 [Suillus discolor]|uniref:Uncharacterized protein n=1 Tax=Suillus discolor TaxID=1912936 RepID=A0A9P7FFT1_9AGAM|nr:uncharacterized protein F5147DRAFT_757908 [Suillus discolor]KAG2117121.1 hypothetical protein F5147DRAFT_757908 [Suillus discolor]
MVKMWNETEKRWNGPTVRIQRAGIRSQGKQKEESHIGGTSQRCGTTLVVESREERAYTCIEADDARDGNGPEDPINGKSVKEDEPVDGEGEDEGKMIGGPRDRCYL